MKGGKGTMFAKIPNTNTGDIGNDKFIKGGDRGI